ncbi:hypothetical protein ES703_121062 [subsurface metagenome]
MPEPEIIEFKGEIVGKVAGCQLVVTTDDKGKKHFEATCASKEARDELAAIFEEEAILRINPKVILEEAPVEPLKES